MKNQVSSKLPYQSITIKSIPYSPFIAETPVYFSKVPPLRGDPCTPSVHPEYRPTAPPGLSQEPPTAS